MVERKKYSNLLLLQRMYKDWPFIDNLQMALMKADLLAAKDYTTMVRDQRVAQRIFAEIEAEYNRTKNIILQITEQEDLMDHIPNIKASIQLRNPYVDPLSFFQVKVISKLREANETLPNDGLLREALLTINGIAAGIRNTG
ncbi:hypothetical protein CIB87_11055 [Priestia megaterium]|uniref:Phosphoenolpyruvate carboxylase n=1 Tax=Priestia megaterium TaxID=1404 RepID=A0AA86LTL2_PRIMG|nr:phosphoenolpyruvate carboxylase [Priestia megaterium]AXI29520.1 hypothetical protein CIB87_11055 [Priestia megaterium]